MIYISDKRCRKNKKETHFTFSNIFPPQIVLFTRQCGKRWYSHTAVDDNIWRMRIACWVTKTTHTLGICNTHSFPKTTVPRTRLNITLYAHCVSCSIRACDFIQYFLYSKRKETQIKIQCCPVPFLVWFILRRYRCSHCTASMADGCLQIWSIGTIIIGEDRRAQRQASLSTTLSITSPIQNTVASNPDLRGEKPATNRLSYDMVCYGAFQSS